MKILFLDFDGVLNSKQWFLDHKEEITESTSLLTRGVAEIDPTAVQRVVDIIDATGAAVVISSSWRHLHPLKEIVEILRDRGFPQFEHFIIDKTPSDREVQAHGVPPDTGVWRGHEIEFWIKNFESKNGKLTSFCILDDDSDMLSSQHPNFVQTSWDHGIQPEDVQRAIQILGQHNVPL